MNADIETIRRTVRKHHGGFEKATDGEILALWRTIPPSRQGAMLASETAGRRDAEGAEEAEATGKRQQKNHTTRGGEPEDKSASRNSRSAMEGAHDADSPEPE